MGTFDMEYLTWLGHYIRCEDHPGGGYLLYVMAAVPFRYDIQLDKNTEYYGLQLREQFFKETGQTAASNDMPCSLLEAIVAIAHCIEWNIFYDPDEDKTQQWFWIMMDNLGLTQLPDNVMDICNRLLDRDYGPYGEGSLCGPIGNGDDIRVMPFYAQCELWIVKNMFNGG